MTRWLLVLLALLLPLQLAWASVAAVCGDAHEPGAGHAVHLHLDAPDAQPGDAAEPDCGHCHGHFSALPLSSAVQPAVPAPLATSQPPVRRLVPLPAPRPERPQWTCLA